MKKLSKKMIFFIGSIILFIGVLSLYLVNTPIEITRVEELQIEQAEKEKNESKQVLTRKSGDSKINIVEKKDPYLEKTLFPLINDVINYEYISYDTESSYDPELGYISYYISPDMVSEYGANEDMWAELAGKLDGLLKKNEEENPNEIDYNLLVKELNKDEKVFLYLRQNGETTGVYAPIIEVNESETSEEIDENVYLEERVTFNQVLSEALLSVRIKLEDSNEYTDELGQDLTDLGLVIGDYLLENTPTKKYTESEKVLRSTLNLYSKFKAELPYAMRDKDTEKILELQKTLDGANKMWDVSNYLLNDEAIEELE